MKYYHLRPGDFRAEELTPTAYNRLGYPSEEIARKQLSKAGNLFSSMEVARRASENVREMLIRFQTGSQCSARLQELPDYQFLTIGRATEILHDIEQLADKYGYSTTDRAAVAELIGKVLLGWSMEFRLRRGEHLRNADKQDTRSPNP